MIGFRSARGGCDATGGAAHTMGPGAGNDRTNRDRPFGRRLADIIGEIGAAIETPRGGSSGERR